jgi:hypothetical protein
MKGRRDLVNEFRFNRDHLDTSFAGYGETTDPSP